LIAEIIRRFERRGLQIVGLKLMTVDKALAEKHYAEHARKPFFKGLVDHITCCPIVAMVLEGPNAVDIARTTIGATNPTAAAPGSIRGDFGVSIGRNLVHGSDSVASSEREVALFFEDAELMRYTRAADQWVFES
jgi:nucleoside-diphosphate kinase